jgi:predicted flap endonuclease-1-like 5' DNA nuclease
MLSNRSTKTLIAVFALVAGILLTIKYIIDDTPLREWWLAGVLFVISAALWLWMWQEDQRAKRESQEGTAAKAEKAVAKAEAAISKAKEAVPAAPVAEKAAPPKEPAPVKAKPAPTEEKPKPVKEKPAPVETKKEPAADEVDDLTRIEGVGPKYRDALIDAGIQTFDQLAKTSEDELVAIVKAAKMRRAASMATWAEQAGYAARDDWEGLDKLQSDLKGGRR